MVRNPGSPWVQTLPPRTSSVAGMDVSGLRTICDSNLGSPGLLSCANAGSGFRDGGDEIELDPRDGP